MDQATSDEFEHALGQVMAAYRKLPTDNLVSDTMIRTGDGADSARWAAAATLGFSRANHYLDTARSLMEEREEISWGMRTYGLILDELHRGGPRTAATQRKIVRAAKLELGAKYLSVHAEVLWHFYAASLQHSWHFLENSAKVVDPAYARTAEERDHLELIRAFRNHMEHRDKATSDIRSDDWLSMSIDEEQALLVGYRRDQENNIYFVPSTGPLKGTEQKMPMNPAGLQRFETILIAAYERLRRTCFMRLEQYFNAHPDRLPSVDQVGKTLTDHMDPVEGFGA